MPFKPKFICDIIAQTSNFEGLTASLNSLHSQLYPDWEACLWISKKVNKNLTRRGIHRFLRDPRVSLDIFADQKSLLQKLDHHLNNSNCDFLGYLKPGTTLSPQALYLLADQINQHPHAILFYTDEDRLNANGLRISPYFKPDWNPELIHHQDYINNFAVYKVDKLKNSGGFSGTSYERLFWDLAIRNTKDINPEDIRHLPFPLCHTSDERFQKSEKNSSWKSSNQASQRVNALPNDRTRYPIPDLPPMATLIIPTRNAQPVLSRCLNSIETHTPYKNLEILVVDNQSEEPDAITYLESLKNSPKITLLQYRHPFNFSAINNFAAQHAQGDVLVFLNNDIEVITTGWLESLVRHALRPEIGAVGAMLYYPNDKIQHAGVMLGLTSVAGHIYKGQPRGYRGVRNRATFPQNFTAITAACLAVQKSKFQQVSGFDEINLPIAFNDIDLCIRLHQEGYRNLWTPYVELYHYESATRGPDEVPHNIERLKAESAFMLKKYGDFLKHDPAYNPNLALDDLNFNLAFPPRIEKPWQKP